MLLYWRMNCLKKLDPFFLILLPNGKKFLYRCNAKYWTDMVDIIEYFKEECGDDLTIRHITKREARKYIRGKYNVNQ